MSQERISAKELRARGGLEALLKSERSVTSKKGEKCGTREAGQQSVPTEHDEQVEFFAWAEGWLPPEMFAVLFAVPNGGHRFEAVAAKLKAEGVKAGIPDIFFAWARLGYYGLFIEMKRAKGGHLSAHQEKAIASLHRAGYLVVVCKGCAEAQETMRAYMIGNGKEFE